MIRTSRRSMLTLLAAGSLGVAGCTATGGTPTSSSTGSTSTAADTPKPNSLPFDAVTPDIPATEAVPPGFYSYPEPPVAYSSEVTARGQVSMIMQGVPPAVAPGSNTWFAKLRGDLGVELDATFAMYGSEYLSKIQVLLAGGDLPDLMMLVQVPQYGKLLDAKFVDLTPVLAGDAVRQYPGLANIPASAWQTTTLGGKIRGIPQPRPPAPMVAMTRGDILESLGMDAAPAPSSGEEFLTMCRELTSKAENRFAFGEDPRRTLVYISQLTGAPNSWEKRDSGFIAAVETPEYAQALEIVTQMWNEGLFYPNSFTEPNNSATWWEAGATIFNVQGFALWGRNAALKPDHKIDVMRPNAWDGGDPSFHLSAAAYGAMIGIPKSAEDRVPDLLSVMNYFSAPFGTDTFLTVNYGIEGKHYALNSGTLEVLPATTNESMNGLPYLGSPANNVLYVPGEKDLVDQMATYLGETVPNGKSLGTVGLSSDTATQEGAVASQKLDQMAADIIQGRKPHSEWETAVADWRTAAGDKIRAEYGLSAG